MNEEMMKRSKEGGEGREKDHHMEEITFENLTTYSSVASVRESPRRGGWPHSCQSQPSWRPS